MTNDRVRESELIRLLDAIYDAAFEPGRWEEVLRSAVDLYGCHAGKVGSIDVQTGAATTLALRGIDPELHDLWEAEFADRDVWAEAGLEEVSRRPDHRTFTGAQLVGPDELHRAPVYQEILRRCDVEDLVSNVLAWTQTTVGFLAIYRSPDLPPFDTRDRELHDWIGRHARRAFALGSILRSERSRSRDFLERLPCAAFVCQADGRIVLHNRRAESLLRREDGLRARAGRLRAAHRPSRDRLERSLALATRSAAGQGLAGGSTLRVEREPGRSPLSIFVDPVPSEGADTAVFGDPFAQPAALVLASDPDVRTRLPEEALASAFGLTPTEARMLAALCAGDTPAEYAELHRISRETARFHVKQLLAKTGARRQADLVRRGLESVARLATPAPEPGAGDGSGEPSG